MKLETLKDLYIHELRDLYTAEQQLVKALPKMAKAANNKELAAGFQEHFEQTKASHLRNDWPKEILRPSAGCRTP
jgi:ferritin-like metal-binding protein YciE